MKITIIQLLICFPLLLSAQENTPKQDLKIEQVAKYDLSNEITAYTFKLVSPNNAASTQDIAPAIEPEQEVKNIISAFQQKEGVKECSFDNATQTFTVITGPLTDLSEVFKAINSNSF